MVGVEHAPNLVAWLAGQGIEAQAGAGDLDAAIRAQDEDVILRIGDGLRERLARRPAGAGGDRARQHAPGFATFPVRAHAKPRSTPYGQQVGALRLLARGINPSDRARRSRSRTATWRRPKRGAAWSLAVPAVPADPQRVPRWRVPDHRCDRGRARATVARTVAGDAGASRRDRERQDRWRRAWSAGVSLLLTLIAFKISAAVLAAARHASMDVSMPAIAKMLLILLPMLFIGTRC